MSEAESAQPDDSTGPDQDAQPAPEVVSDTGAAEPVVVPVEPTTPAPAEPEPAEVEAEPESAVEPAPAVSTEPEPATEPESAAPEVETEPAPAVAEPAPEVVASSSAPTPPSGPPPKLSTPAPEIPSDAGKVIGGTITAISAEEVELNLDDGRPAVINRRNFDDAGSDPTTVYSVGDRVEGAVLVRQDPKKRVVLSRAWAIKKQSWEKMAELAESGEVISATVSGVSKRGVVVDVGVRGFVPASHLELQPPSDLKSYVGQTLELKVLELDIDKERLVLSRRSLLLREQRKAVHDLLTSLTVGETRTGTVASLVEYGAFVDVGGVTGLVHLSELSWERVRKPSDVVKVGDEVQVKVLDVKVKKRRISLSMRQLSADPLDTIPVGEVVTGPVTRLVDFGAFVDVGGGEGLVHLSELSEYRVFAPEEVVTPGEEVRVKVLSVDKKRRRIELSIRQAVSDDFG